MKTIYKYPLAIADDQLVRMPAGAQLLCVQVQPVPIHGVLRRTPCVWAMVDTDHESVGRHIMTTGTGHDATELVRDSYVGTYQLNDGGLVFHVFDGGER